MNKNINKKRVGLATLGCKVNQYESAYLAEQLRTKNFLLVPFDSYADIYIINTCTVTAYADSQSRQLIRRARRLNPEAKIIVTGCYAEISPESIAKVDSVSLILGNAQKKIIPEIIEKDDISAKKIIDRHVCSIDESLHIPISSFLEHTRAFLKIQDGCDSFCSYCIIPYARGEKHSLSLKNVLVSVNEFIKNGYREIVLTGIHLGAYGQDLIPPTNLESLLRKLKYINPSVRFRLSSIEPLEITDGLLKIFSESAIFCPHLHIPLQSGDDNILRLMKRNYTSSFFRNLIKKIISSVKNVSIGIDVIVGFPGEGDKEFNNTLSFIEDLPIAYMHVFSYSERPKTVASKLYPKVPHEINKERAYLLRELNVNKRKQFAKRFIGKELLVLIEKSKDKKTGFLKGFSQNYLPVLLETNNPYLINKIVPVYAEKYENGKLYGKIISR